MIRELLLGVLSSDMARDILRLGCDWTDRGRKGGFVFKTFTRQLEFDCVLHGLDRLTYGHIVKLFANNVRNSHDDLRI